MKRREFSVSAASVLAASTVTLAAMPAHAQNKPQAGKDYAVLDTRAPVDTPADKVEVIEFFWYSCSHCNAFEPALNNWIKAQPKDVVIKRVPVAFQDSFIPQQKLFYALEALGKVEALLADAGREWAYAHSVARRVCKVERIEWCNPDQLAKVIAALQIDADRRARRAAAG